MVQIWLKWAEVGRSLVKSKERLQKMVKCGKVKGKVAKGDKLWQSVGKLGKVGQSSSK